MASHQMGAGRMKLIMGGEEPQRVPDVVISSLRDRERNGLIVLPTPAPSAPHFQPGDKVRVKVGPLMGFPGLVSTMRPRQRVEVLLQMLGGLQRVELAAARSRRLDGRPAAAKFGGIRLAAVSISRRRSRSPHGPIGEDRSWHGMGPNLQ